MAVNNWIHVVSDLAIWGAYTGIAVVLAMFLKRRRNVPSRRLFWLFVLFITASGATHLLSGVMFFWPVHNLHAGAKIVAAVAAWATFASILFAAPLLLTLPGLAKNNEDMVEEMEERKRAQQLLRRSQEHLQLILDATRVATWDYSIATREAQWSPTLETLHGFQPGSFDGKWKTLLAVVHPEDCPLVERALARTLQTGQDSTLEYRVQKPNGTGYIEAKAHVIRDEQGQPLRIAGICIDTSARKQADLRFRMAVEAAPSAVVLANEAGKIILANSRVRELFGYEPEELIGEPVEILVPDRFRSAHPAFRNTFNRSPQSRPMGSGRDLFGLRKNGTEVPVEIGLSPIRTEEGLMVLATVVDITNRRLAEQERQHLLEAERAARSEGERANRLKDMFLANVSHELRTPLNAILGWSQLLNRETLHGQAAQAVEIIQRNARVQAKLIEDLLDVSRIISGKIRLEMEPVELPIVVNSAIDALLPAAQVKDIEIERSIDSNISPVHGDASRLQQVVWNLLSNAIKFTPKDGKVSVEVSCQGTAARIVVSDSGCGIKPDFLPFLFDRFRQGDPSTTRSHPGLGLGLSIVKHLVELHGGSVEAASAGGDRGSTFTVLLPINPLATGTAKRLRPEASYEDNHMERASVRNDPCSLAGTKVLVVDDDVDACILAKRVLEDCGATVTTATSAAEGLRIFKPFQPDVIISDISMPDQDGYQFIQQIRNREAATGVMTPAAALTAFTRPEDRARALLAGYQAHIPKPLAAAELIAVVANLTGRSANAESSASTVATTREPK